MSFFAALRGSMALIFAGLGAVIAYEDFSTHKIRNVRIKAGLGFCVAGYAALFAAGHWSAVALPAGFFERALVHALLSLAIALVLWQTDIWPAGDAKLLILAAILIPLLDLEPPRFPHALFLVLLINIFIPCMAYTLVYIVLRYARKWAEGTTSPGWLLAGWLEFLRGKARALSAGDLKTFAAFFAIFIASTGVRFVLMRAAGYWLTMHALFYLLLYLYWDQLSSLMREKMGSALLVLSAAYLAIGAAVFPGILLAHLRYAGAAYAGFGGLFMLLRMALEQGTRALEGRPLDAALAEPGMVPLELKLDERFAWDDFGPLSRDGLSADQAAQLRRWAQGLPPESRLITVSRDGRAFAGWIIAGTALTLLIRKDVLHLF